VGKNHKLAKMNIFGKSKEFADWIGWTCFEIKPVAEVVSGPLTRHRQA
jgi:hypothetical protein